GQGDRYLLQALVNDTAIFTRGSLTISADNTSSITADVGAVAAAVGIGGGIVGVGVGLAGAGSNATNEIRISQLAGFDGNTSNSNTAQTAGGSGRMLVAGDVSITAVQRSRIDSTAFGAALGAGLAGGLVAVGVGAAIGASLSENLLDEDVDVVLADVATGSRVGSLTLSASKLKAGDAEANISATSSAAAVALGIGVGIGAGVALAGGGANSFNTLTGNLRSLVSNVDLTSSGTISVSTGNDQRVTAEVVAVSAAVAGGLGGAAAGVGATVAENRIGVATFDATERSDLTATVRESRLRTTGVNADITITADQRAASALTSVPVSSAVAIAIGAGAAGAGGTSRTRMAYDVEASTANSDLLAARDLSILSKTNNESDQYLVPAAVSGGYVAVSIAAATTTTVVDNVNRALVTGAAVGGDQTRLVVAGRNLAVRAEDTQTRVNAASTPVSVAIGDLALAGGGADVTGTIGNQIAATVSGKVTVRAGRADLQTIEHDSIRSADADSNDTQLDRLTVGGTYDVGDEVTLSFAQGDATTTVRLTVTDPSQAAIAAQIAELVNATTGVGAGAGSFVTATADAGRITLTGRSAAVAFVLTASATDPLIGRLQVAAPAQGTTLQQDRLTLSGSFVAGSQLGVTLTHAASGTQTVVTSTVEAADLVDDAGGTLGDAAARSRVRDRLLGALAAVAGVTTGAGAYLQVAADPADGAVILLSGLAAGDAYLVSVSTAAAAPAGASTVTPTVDELVAGDTSTAVQEEAVRLSGPFRVGDTVTLTLQALDPETSASQPRLVRATTTRSSDTAGFKAAQVETLTLSGDVRAGLLLTVAINPDADSDDVTTVRIVAASNDLATVRQQLLTAITAAGLDYLTATAGTAAGSIRLTATTAGEGFAVATQAGRDARSFSVTVAEGRTSHAAILEDLAGLMADREAVTSGVGAFVAVVDQSSGDTPQLVFRGLTATQAFRVDTSIPPSNAAVKAEQTTPNVVGDSIRDRARITIAGSFAIGDTITLVVTRSDGVAAAATPVSLTYTVMSSGSDNSQAESLDDIRGNLHSLLVAASTTSQGGLSFLGVTTADGVAVLTARAEGTTFDAAISSTAATGTVSVVNDQITLVAQAQVTTVSLPDSYVAGDRIRLALTPAGAAQPVFLDYDVTADASTPAAVALLRDQLVVAVNARAGFESVVATAGADDRMLLVTAAAPGTPFALDSRLTPFTQARPATLVTTTLVPNAPLTQAAVAQQAAIDLDGTLLDGDVLRLLVRRRLLATDAAHEILVPVTTATSGLANRRAALIAAINAMPGVGTGSDGFVTATVDPANAGRILVTATRAGEAFELSSNVIRAIDPVFIRTTSQEANSALATVQVGWEAGGAAALAFGTGRQLVIEVASSGRDTVRVSYLLPASTSAGDLVAGLVQVLNAQAGLTTGSAAIVRFSSVVVDGTPRLQAQALNPGVVFDLSATIVQPVATGPGGLAVTSIDTSRSAVDRQEIDFLGGYAAGDSLALTVWLDRAAALPPAAITIPVTLTTSHFQDAAGAPLTGAALAASVAKAGSAALAANASVAAALRIELDEAVPGRLVLTARDARRFAVSATAAGGSHSASLKVEAVTLGTTIDGQVVNVTVAGGALSGAVGAATVNHTIADAVAATVTGSDPAFWSSGSLAITAASNELVRTTRTRGVAASVGLLSAGSVLVNQADATITTTVLAQAAGTLEAVDAIVVDAKGSNRISTEAIGAATAAGTVGVGIGQMVANSRLGSTTVLSDAAPAEVEAAVAGNAKLRAKNITVSSESEDEVIADAISSAAGIGAVALAGAGAISTTRTDQTTRTRIGGGASLEASQSVTVTSLADQSSADGDDGQVDSRGFGIAVAAGFIGVAGAGVTLVNEVFSQSLVDVGSSSSIVGNAVQIHARNAFEKNRFGGSGVDQQDDTPDPDGNSTQTTDVNVRVEAVTVPLSSSVAGVGSGSSTLLGDDTRSFGSSVSFGSSSVVRATGTTAAPGTLTIQADNDVVATDYALLDAISLVAAAGSRSAVRNNATATVSAGSRSSITNDAGEVLVSATGNGLVSASSSAFSGAVGVGAVESTAANRPTNRIELDAATITGDRVRLWAGQSNAGVPAILSTYSDAQITTSIVGITPGFATTVTADTNAVDLKGTAAVLSRGNVEINARDAFSTVQSTTDSGAGAGQTRTGVENDDTDERTLRGQASATVRILAFAPIPGTITTTDTTTNTISIADTARVVAGLNHDLQIRVVPHGASAESLNGSLGIETGGFTAPLADGHVLTGAEKSALGFSTSVAYEYHVLPAPTGADGLSNAVAVILPASVWADSSNRPQLEVRDLGADLAELYRSLTALIAEYVASPSTQARYLAQRQEIFQQAMDLGFVDASGVIAENRSALAVVLPRLTAAPGSVFLEALGTGGAITSGTTNLIPAPATVPTTIQVAASATINVANVLPILMVGRDMQINDSRLRTVVTDAAGVSRYTVFTPGKLYVNRQGGASGTDIAGLPEPSSEIVVSQVPITALELAAAPADAAAVPPDLYLEGSIINESGRIGIRNTGGSVIVSGELRGEPIDIFSSANFSLVSDDWLHVGGDPRQQIDTDLYRSTVLDEAMAGVTYPAGGMAVLPDESLTKTVADLRSSLLTGTSAIVSAGRIAINARYLNVNGLIQSGVAEYSLTVAEDFAPARSTALVRAAGGGIDGISFGTVANVSIPLAGYANLGTKTIELDPIRARGGDISLTGQIVSTGGGRVLAFSGQPRLTIDNKSDWALALDVVDLKPVVGKVTITNAPQVSLPVASVSGTSLVFAVSHGLATGDTVAVDYIDGVTRNSDTGASEVDSTTPVSGLSAGSFYKVIRVDDTTIRLGTLAAPSQAIALGTATAQTLAYRSFSVIPERPVTQAVLTYADGAVTTSTFAYNSATGAYDLPVTATLFAGGTTTSAVAPATGLQTVTRQYLPTAGLTYGWSEGQAKTSTVVQSYQQRSFNLFGFDWHNPLGTLPDINAVSRTTTYTDGTPLLNGEWLQARVPSGWTTGTGDSATIYGLGYQQRTTAAGLPTTRQWTTGGGWLRSKTFHVQTTTITGLQDFYTHSLKADWPITVGFEVPSNGGGAISITSKGDVTFSDEVRNFRSLTASSSEGGITASQLYLDDGARADLTAAADVAVMLGGSAASVARISLTATAGGDLTVSTFANGGAVAAVDLARRTDGSPALVAGGRLALNTAGTVLLPAGEADATAPLLRADRVELQVGAGSLGSVANPLRIDSATSGAADAGLSLELGGSAGGYVVEVQGDLQLVLPESFAATAAVNVGGALGLEVLGGSLIDRTGRIAAADDLTGLRQADALLKITGEAGAARARREIATEDQTDYVSYWSTYHASAGAADEFQFTAEQRQMLAASGLSEAAIDAREARLADVHAAVRELGQAGAEAGFVYSRPAAKYAEALAARTVGFNTYYYPLQPSVRALLAPDAARPDIPEIPLVVTPAVVASSLVLRAAGDIGRVAETVTIEIPAGGFDALAAADAAVLSQAATDDIVGVRYAVYRVLGDQPIVVGAGPLDLADQTRFERFAADHVAGGGTLWRFIGTTPRTFADPLGIDFSAVDDEGRPLWTIEPTVDPDGIVLSNAADSLSVTTDSLVRDVAADLAPGAIVLVSSPAFFGYYRFLGSAEADVLLPLEDYGRSTRWEPLVVGSAAAVVTATQHPGTLSAGTLVTDPYLAEAVTVRRQAPLGIALAADGVLSASANGMQIRAAGQLTIERIEANGLVGIQADSIGQAAVDSAGVSNVRGSIDLRASAGGIGSAAVPLFVTTGGNASLSAEATGAAWFQGSSQLAIGSVSGAAISVAV
ncbi:MAG: hypothetical protein RLZZ440_2701, partial [Planctomycetota bacterium]